MLIAIACCLSIAPVPAQEANPVDPDFRPSVVGAKMSTDRVRPGDRFAIEFEFRNDGTKPGVREYRVFLHFEYPEPDCRDIRMALDHEATVSTTRWTPGKVVKDGPYAIAVPAEAKPGEYHVHVGLFDAMGDGRRLLDTYVGKITVDPAAPPHSPHQEPLAAGEAARRREALAGRIKQPLTLDGGSFVLHVSPQTGTWEIIDRRTNELWASSPLVEGIGEVTLAGRERTVVAPLDKVERAEASGNAIVLHYRPSPPAALPGGEGREVWVKLERVGDPDGLRVSYEADEAEEWRIVGVRLLDNALFVTNNESGSLVVPHRIGILLRAEGGIPDTRRFSPYGNAYAYSMSFAGAVKNGSAMMVTWEDPYTTLETRSTWTDHPLVPGSQLLSLSLMQTKSARAFTIYPLGKGGYVHVAKAYREIANRRGLLKTWEQKVSEYPDAARMFGAADLKPFVFVRSVSGTPWNQTGKDILSVGYTFDEAAQVAEHFRRDLGIEHAMFVLAGWIHRGYDNQHPDILPAAPECGGDEALIECSKRVRACGYLFGLHDNYQDMYRDAPSWDESYIMRNADGSLCAGGVWAGGQAYLTCSRRAIELAKRPQNLAEVRRLFDPSIYFIDTTFAAPPYECFDPQHPLTRSDDIRYKAELCDYAREMMGLFGSEEGQEWAVPHADYFEGLMSHKCGDDGQEVIPLFEIAYGDCINLYTHQGDRASPERADYILDHILYAEMPVYAFGQHLYFRTGEGQGGVPARPEVAEVKQTGPRTFAITYRWTVSGAVGKLPIMFVHFTSPQATRAEQIAFQNDHTLSTEPWKAGDVVTDGPYTVEIPEGIDGEFGVMVGLVDEGGGRQELRGLSGVGGRFRLGTLTLQDGRISFRSDDPSKPPANLCFSRADGGAKGLIETDRFIKNTYEVLSPLDRLTAQRPMTDHEFVSAKPRVERSRFGDDVDIIVNHGPGAYTANGVELPEYGFVVRSPTFCAFHATEFGQIRYGPSAMFVVQSMDGKPITESQKVRIYHAFGDKRVDVGGKVFEVEGEAEVSVRG